MGFKFEKLEVWKRSLDYIDLIYEIAEQLPANERYNLQSQLKRAVTSVALNIAEGSTGQTDAEQARFLGLAIRSLLETVACQHIVARRNLLPDPAPLRKAYAEAQTLSAMLHAFRKRIAPTQSWLREAGSDYSVTDTDSDSTEQPP